MPDIVLYKDIIVCILPWQDPELASEVELHERLSCLLAELEPYEQKLIQLNKKMKIKLRKEHENYVEEPPDKQQVEMTSYYCCLSLISFIISWHVISVWSVCLSVR